MPIFVSVMFLCAGDICDFVYSGATFDTVEECKQVETEYVKRFEDQGLLIVGTACIPVNTKPLSTARM